MRRTFGLTALLLLGIAVLAVAGCTGTAGSGVGLLRPFSPEGTRTPTASPSTSPSPAPSISPAPLGTENVLINQNNPSRLAFNTSCTDWLLVTGFNLGANNGDVTRFRVDTVNGASPTDSTSPQQFTFTLGGTPFQLTNPVWIDFGIDPLTGEQFFVVTEGLGTANGRVLLIKPAQSTTCQFTGSATAVDLGALAATTPVNPLGVDFDGTYVWWTEYLGGAAGLVRRADLTQNPIVVEDFATGLEFPAGIESNGNFVAFAQNGGNNYIVAPTEPTSLPIAGPDVNVLTEATGDPLLLRPFEVRWTQNDTLVALDGFGFTVAGGPGPAGAGNGNLRFFNGPGLNFANTTLELVVGGLTDPAGVDIIFDGQANTSQNRIDVAFVETLNQNGTLNRVGFSTLTPFTVATNQQLLTSLQRPFHAAVAIPVLSSDAAPVAFPTQFSVFVTNGLDLGVSNGSVIRQTSTF